MNQSPKWTLDRKDVENQLKSAAIWLTPLICIYLVQINTTLNNAHILGFNDLRPTASTIGAMQLYILNQVFGLMKKLHAGE